MPRFRLVIPIIILADPFTYQTLHLFIIYIGILHRILKFNFKPRCDLIMIYRVIFY
jgi:hypothetical protein